MIDKAINVARRAVRVARRVRASGLSAILPAAPLAAAAPVVAAGTTPGQNTNTGLGDAATQDYWSDFNVTLHRQFKSAEDSLGFFDWRNDQYAGYIELMPVKGFDGKTVLDFGCGPGHDLIGFAHYSKCARLVGTDISRTSTVEARARLALHGGHGEVIQLDPNNARLPFDDNTFDHMHSSGVLHHTPDINPVLRELHRVLKPGGTFNVMVYNYDSLWMHLHTAYSKCIVEGQYKGLTLRQAFTKTTDTEDCPIADCYTPDEFVGICTRNGFKARFTGAAISMHELLIAPTRFAAIQDQRLPSESRRFLLALEPDKDGYPRYRGHRAGIDACFQLTK